jgi:ankyrin repeat protein
MDKDKLENRFINLCDDKYFDELVKFIKQNKEKIDIDIGFTWACAYNHSKVAKYLLKEHNANIHAKNNYAVRWACTRGYNDLVKYLLFSDELKENASIEAAFLISLEFNQTMIEYLICETNKEVRSQIKEILNRTPNSSRNEYPQELLNKMSLVDNLKEELPNNLESNKKIKI